MSELPKGWMQTSLGELCTKLTDGSHNPPKAKATGLPMLSAKNIQNGKLDFGLGSRLITEEEFVAEDKRTRISKGDVLLTIVGALGRSAIVSTHEKFTLQRSVAVLSAPIISSDYLKYAIESPSFQKQIFDNAKGTAQKGIYLKKLRELNMVLPPLAEQKRIVEKLDEVLAQVDTIKARLDGIPDLLKRFRQSVLASAVSGKLTEEWRRENGEDSSWKQITLKDAAHIQDPHPSHRTPPVVEGGIPFVSIGDLREDGSIDIENARKVSPEVLKEHKARYTLKEGDFIFGKIGTLGKATVLPMSVDFALSANVILIQPEISLAEPKYIQYFLSSPTTMDEVAKQANSTSQSAFGIKKMRAFVCSLPSKIEQTEIVRLVDQYFAFADTIEAQVKKAQARVDNLTQSILAKAFRGELVPQNDDDESAEVLLERIAQARKEAEVLAKVAKKAAKKKA
ncbi:restriction endonuclease subunit S [Vibrio alginolyticus]|nr:restriction endonuclease subunit S [Vibrio alginolyticus]